MHPGIQTQGSIQRSPSRDDTLPPPLPRGRPCLTFPTAFSAEIKANRAEGLLRAALVKCAGRVGGAAMDGAT